ncbi:hypothetical protein F444_21464 [Phytophthora nicotianae P1976]|uniref:Uncharacterized protein n=1 Tax=Phytophthora nicotianae P1976 TaxID=1317066 RepID=A0A080Z0Z8_PHYNI|nr:hypothetical protein F444_21464 [Phytophthora nicotianae P1976]
MISTKSNEEFLAEVECFLNTCDFPVITSGHERENVNELNAVSVHEHVTYARSDCSSDGQPRSDEEEEREKGPRICRTYYERRKAERVHLRQQVKELASKLAKQKKTNAGSVVQMASSWWLVARWQRAARLNAEEQKRRLWAAVDTRAALIQALQTTLHTSLGQQIDVTSELFKNSAELLADKNKRINFDSSDAETFAAFVHELDVIYSQTDKALHAISLESTSKDWDAPRQTWKEDSKTGCYLYMSHQTISSDFKETCAVLWQVAYMTHRQENREVFCAVDPENTVAIKFRITTRLNSGRIASVLQRVVTRRYQEDGRMILAWRSFAEGEGIFTDMYADETGWCAATPLSKHETLLRICMRHVPMHFRGVTTNKPEVDQFKNLVLDTGSNDVFEVTTRLESLLLQEA